MMKAPQPLTSAQAAHFKWVAAPPVARVVAALVAAEAGSARFVGGCVRDSLLGIAPKDIDIATTLTPEQAAAALRAQGLGVALTGVEHGTITAIADHVGVEVTTLRADVSTDGRRATVEFTRDWKKDAQRRDFTINALYLTPELVLHDDVGGVDDLRRCRVRFIGAPVDRIREDYLRVLRFFRFSARFSDQFDEAGLAACAAEKKGLAILSAERIGAELCRILEHKAPQRAFAAMLATGVLAEIWPEPPAIETLARLKSADPEAPPALALAALWGAKADSLSTRLRLSNADAGRRKAALANADLLAPGLGNRAARALLYKMGEGAWRDACLLAEAKFAAASETPDAARALFAPLRQLPRDWPPPERPFAGKDALAAGAPEGPVISRIVKAAEARWIEEDFPPLARAREIFAEELAKAISKD